MASISDKDFYHLSVSINKALNPMEAPLKIKHARSVIIMTHRTKEAKSFWAVVTRQPLMENRFTAWKFCHLLHKVLREGHSSALKHSQTHRKMILEIGKLWGHLQDGVGNCIQAYSKLLVTKLEFHEKNALFPGALMIDFREVEKFAGEDINVYFQLCVEIFDYLDDIIDLQSRVFGSINTYRMSSMTPQGQCRLAPLITLIQDSNPLYDLCVRIMFKLHDVLPSDILAGHRDRFRELFSKIKYFYDNVRPLQYFADLIQVPHLPEAAPNFTSKVDFGSYIPPVVFVQPDPEPSMDNLIDVKQSTIPSETPAPQTDQLLVLENALRDKELTINQLQFDLSATKSAVNAMENNHKAEKTHLCEQITLLNSELESSRIVHGNMNKLNHELETKMEDMMMLSQKSTEDGEKVKASEEKFNKLKILYTQMRDEHINLLRQHSEANKLLSKEKSDNTKLKSEVEHLQNELSTLDEETKELISSEKNELESKLQDITTKYELLQLAHDSEKEKYDELDSYKRNQIETLTTQSTKLQEEVADLEMCRSKIASLEKSLNETQETLREENERHASVISKYENELESKKCSLNDSQKLHEIDVEVKNNKIEELLEKLSESEIVIQDKEMSVSRLSTEKLLVENEVQDLIQQNSNLETKLKTATEETKELLLVKQENEIRYESLIRSLLHCVLQTMSNISASKYKEPNQPPVEKSLSCLEEIEKLLEELNIVYHKYSESEECVEGLVRKSINLGYHIIMLHEHCLNIYNTTTDIEKGEDIFNQITNFSDPLLELYDLCRHTDKIGNFDSCIAIIKSNICSIRRLIEELRKMKSSNVELGDLVESELREMDKAIEEAVERFVELLSNARSNDNGMKLEVNEKILDACTNLLDCIKLLIQKSKILQQEIVSSGQGNTTAKEFYKRNSQWTEGLISASKSVAKGANLLVDAANKAVSSESNQNFEIIVAAQEIAACTAQLVIASKVKAPRHSQKLVELTKASRNVSQATGAVVATVKDCNQHLEQLQEIDVTKLTSSQAKTMEMDIHVKVLELEQALQTERLKLASFRRNNYQNTEE